MNNTDDSAFLHTFTLLLLGLTAVGIIAFILAGAVADRAESEQPVERGELERTKPAGKINNQENSIKVASIGSLNPAEIGQEQPLLVESEKLTENITKKPVATPERTGEEVYSQACSLCHMAGVAGAPRYADKNAWAPRVNKGLEPLYANAINGYVGEAGVMPAKGGRPDLSDKEVRDAVDYILNSIKN